MQKHANDKYFSNWFIITHIHRKIVQLPANKIDFDSLDKRVDSVRKITVFSLNYYSK